jgi:putative membrane protein
VSASSTRTLRRISAITGAAALIGLTTASSGFAADPAPGDVQVVNTETVQVYLSPSGKVESKRVYEQLALTGHGSVDIKNPVSTAGLRNLDGFGGFDVKDGEQIAKTTVDGTKRYRSVSDFTGTLPVSVTPTYKLDGKTVEPGDVVGKSGKLEVQFVVENKTNKPQDVSFDDGTGKTVTKSVDVPVPMVGSLTTSVPASFTNVEPGGANTAGDGTGGQTLSYNLVLFPPLGSTTSTVGYTADITDGIVPRVDVAMLPVDPLASPTFKVATEGYQGGAETGAQLVTGAETIDGNLLKLRDGAADLLAGLIQLSDGADQLNDGLANDAAPGAKKLADGAGDLDAGLGLLSDGSQKLATGAGQLADGAGDALAGSEQLSDGLKQISGGLSQLAAQLPAAGPGIQQLIDGVNQVIAGFGAAGQAGTLIDGLTQLNAGATQIKSGITGQIVPGIGQSKGGVDQVRSGLNDAIKAGGTIDQLIQGLGAVSGNLLPGMDCGPVCQATINGGILPGVQQSKTDLGAAYAGLGLVSGGLQQVLDGLNGQIVPGLGQLETGSAAALTGAQQLKAGNVQVRDGLTLLKTQLAGAIAGILQLNTGAGAAYAGSGDLADGLGQLDAGAGALSDGASDLADGATDAKDGSGQIADGADDLADGLGDAADGSGKIADGLRTAAGGAPQLVDGAGRLSTEGMGQLKQAGKDTAVNYGELYAVIAAGAQRAQTEAMAFGAPKDAEGLTAYSFVIRGDDGESGRNVTRGVAALALLGLGSGVCVLRRRLV